MITHYRFQDASKWRCEFILPTCFIDALVLNEHRSAGQANKRVVFVSQLRGRPDSGNKD